MFYVISAGLKLQTSILLLSQVSKFKRAEKGPCHWCSRYREAYKGTQKKKKPSKYNFFFHHRVLTSRNLEAQQHVYNFCKLIHWLAFCCGADGFIDSIFACCRFTCIDIWLDVFV